MWFALLLAVPILMTDAGFALGLLITAILIATGIALWWIETRATRGNRNYLRCALAIFLGAWVLVGLPLRLGINPLVGVLLWAGMAAALLAWVYFYERTEPR